MEGSLPQLSSGHHSKAGSSLGWVFPTESYLLTLSASLHKVKISSMRTHRAGAKRELTLLMTVSLPKNIKERKVGVTQVWPAIPNGLLVCSKYSRVLHRIIMKIPFKKITLLHQYEKTNFTLLVVVSPAVPC